MLIEDVGLFTTEGASGAANNYSGGEKGGIMMFRKRKVGPLHLFCLSDKYFDRFLFLCECSRSPIVRRTFFSSFGQFPQYSENEKKQEFSSLTDDDSGFFFPKLVGSECCLDVLVQEIGQDNVPNGSVVLRLIGHNGYFFSFF